MSYTLVFPTGSTSPNFVVNDGSITSTPFYNTATSSGVQLIGRNAVSYGLAVAQNTLQMISNFAGNTSSLPTDAQALQGQLWFNNTTGTLYVRTGATGLPGGIANWTPISTGGAAGVTQIIAGTNITVTPPGGTGIVTINSTGAGGGGTVTSVSVTTANGISGTVATATTTPAITLALGAITPTNVSVTNTTNATSKVTGALQVAGGVGVSGDLWATNIFATGNVTAAAVPSDSRLKTNLRKISESVSKVQQLTGYTFDWDLEVSAAAGFNHDKTRQVGVIAQDVLAVLPEAVAPSPINPEYLTVRYDKLVALLIEAVKEQAKEIELIKKMLK